VLFMTLMLMRCLRCCWLSFDAVVLWCWYDMNYLYVAVDLIWVVSVDLSCEVVRSRPNYWNHISCSRSSSCKMLRLSPLHTHLKKRAYALEPCAQKWRGLMPWSLFMLNSEEGLCPGLVPHAFAYQDDLRWF
jgi:hypothetical protein